MKRLVFAASALFSLLTAVSPASALESESSTLRGSLESDGPTRLRDLGVRVNPQVGVSSFEYSGPSQGSAKSKLSGGATFEFGGSARKVETGLLIMQTGMSATLSDGTTGQVNNTYLTIPMMAKLRLLSMKAQAWYLKVGGMPAFAVSSSERSETNPIDVLGAAGLGGRMLFTKKTDFVIEATYNRGLMDALRTNGSNYNQGFMVLAGLSFAL